MLADCTGDQDMRFARAFAILEEAIGRRAFPGAAVAVTCGGKLLAARGFGHFTYEATSLGVEANTIYDLASVTKVVATTAVVMVLHERGALNLEAPLADLLPEFAAASPDDFPGAQRGDVTLRMLLAHASGLPAYARLFEQFRGAALLRAACSLPLECVPGRRAVYSDIGFLLLGVAVERLMKTGLATLSESLIFKPLDMARTSFRPHPRLRTGIPPTERTALGEVIQGEVQDENARAFAECAENEHFAGRSNADAGHAGVFASAGDVARFAECMLAGGAPILRPETVAMFTRREASPPGTSRALGWDTPSQPSQSGRYFSPGSFGHLGYAGTSLWIDPERRLSVTLLSNRTWPDRQSQLIKEVRPRFHDAVVEAL